MNGNLVEGNRRNMTSLYLRHGNELLLLYRIGSKVVGDSYVASAGGHFESEELNDARACALRELYEETHIKGVETEQIRAFGDVRRDPRARVITTAFMALVRLEDVKAQAGDDAKDAAWFTIDVSEKETEEGSFYAMELSNPERKLLLKPLVCLRETGELIRKEETVIRDRGHVASDHAAILLLAWLKLKRRMENARAKKETKIK